MRTLVVSDLHLGNGGPYDVFEGGTALPALLDHLGGNDLHVIVNGDAVDFLMNDDPLELDVARAVQQAQAIATYSKTAAVLQALGRVLEKGGAVTIRMGNHDVELFLPEVQAVFRKALGQPDAIAAKLVFADGQEPQLLDVGGTRVLVTHGEQNDKWNIVEYDKLRQGGSKYKYAPGSVLVKKILNPGVSEAGMRFLSLLKPDFQGAALTALAVDPAAAKLAWSKASLSMLWQLYRRADMAFTFAEGAEEEPNFELDERLSAAGMNQAELDALEGELGDGVVSFGGDDGALRKAMLKLGKAALSYYAQMQKKLAGPEADDYFSLDPAKEEWTEAQRLSAKYSVNAIIVGHSHAARFRQDSGLMLANSGTWIGLMKLPSQDASDNDWVAFLEELRDNKGLDPAKQKLAKVITRFTAVLVAPHDRGGAAISLVEWGPEGDLTTLRECWVAAQRNA